MNLRSIDLNLLVILDALLDEAHVSRAAARLNLSQPATSSALDRCRHLFGDPLLERGKGGMRLTARAQALRDPLKNLLAGIAAVVDAPEDPLAAIRQTVRIITADHPGILIATPNLTVAHTCALNTDATVYVYGGYVRNKDSSVLTMSDESRRRFKFDVAIIGASAIDEQGTVLEFDPMEVDLVRDVLTQSRKVILVAHDEKFGRRAPHIVITLDQVDTLISNTTPHLVDSTGHPRPLPTRLRLAV